MRAEKDMAKGTSRTLFAAGVRSLSGPGRVAAQRRSARRLAPLVAAVAVVVPLSGCSTRNSARSPANVTVTVTQTGGGVVNPSPTVTKRPKRPPSIAEPASFKTFTGSYFSVDYSGSWYVETSEADKGSYLDMTIRNSVNPQVMLRVDVAPGGAKGNV